MMRNAPALSWIVPAVGAGVWLVLSIAAIASELASNSKPGGPQKDITLGILLLLLAILWLATALFARKTTPPVLQLSWPDLGGALIMAGGLAITAQLTIRLASSSHFGGRASAFDFGLKCSAGTSADCTERNFAFYPEFNSFGHCIQGVLSVFLFPPRFSFLAIGRPSIWDGLFGSSCAVIIYPIYNIVKRTVKSQDWFAASSFANNGAEWAMGFVLGLSMLMLTKTAKGEFSMPPSSLSDPSTAGDVSKADPLSSLKVLRIVAGATLCVVSIIAAVLFGISWNNTAAGTDGADAGVLFGMLLVALVSVLGTVGAASYLAWQARRQAVDLDMGPTSEAVRVAPLQP